MGSTDIADIDLPGEDTQIIFQFPPGFINLISHFIFRPSPLERLQALAYTPEEVTENIVRETASYYQDCCESSILKGGFRWHDRKQNCCFCNSCALKYGWRQEMPIDFIVIKMGLNFLDQVKLKYLYPKFGPRENVFLEIAKYVDKKKMFWSLIQLQILVQKDSSKELELTEWMKKFKEDHCPLTDGFENDPEMSYVLLGKLLFHFPLNLFLEKEIDQPKLDKSWVRERHHPYRLRKVEYTSEKRLNPEYQKYQMIIGELYQICQKGLDIYYTKWDNNVENYVKIIKEAFPDSD